MKALLLALLLGAPLTAADVASGTLALYFDDSRCAGETADASSNGYTLTENGAVDYNTSPAPPVGTKNVGVFTAANYYDAPAGLRTAWSSLTNFTWQSYIYLTALPGGGSFYYFMSLNSSSGVGGCYVDSAGAFHCHIGATYIDGSAAGIAAGEWVHVAFTRSSTDGKMRIYINNASAATAVTVGTNGTVSDLEIGRYYAGTLPTNGYFNQTRFSNVAETSFPTVDPSGTLINLSPYVNQGTTPYMMRIPR